MIGQATDLRGLTPCPPRPRDGAFRVLALGRTSRAKGFDVVIRAAAELRSRGVDVEVEVVGPSVTEPEAAHRVELERLIAELDLGDRVRLRPGVPRSAIRDVICAADVLANAMVAGSGDKVVFEAAALGRPVVVSNPSFAGLLEGLPIALTFPEADHHVLADRLAALSTSDPRALARVVATVRERVERQHSLDHWADAIVALADRLRERPRRRGAPVSGRRPRTAREPSAERRRP